MLLLIDAGNSAIKWAIAVGAELGRWQQSGACPQSPATRLADAWRGLPVTRALVSNVAGPAARERLAAQLLQAFGSACAIEWFASRSQLAGVRNGYRQPAQLGCDRFAAAIGARALWPGAPLIIATCGTATTIDALAADGVFLGGMILPGLRLMAQALGQQTAQLPDVAQRAVELAPVRRRFADNTVDAIVSGCIAAQAGAIERALAQHAQTAGTEVRCVLAGGAAALIAPYLAVVPERVDNLVLIGLQVVAMDGALIC